MVFSRNSESKIDEEWDFEHQHLCDFIRQWVDDNFLNNVANEMQTRHHDPDLKSFMFLKPGITN